MYKRILKPLFDFLFALALLPFVLIIMIILYPIVKLNSKGPFLFKGYRLGKNGRHFKMYKIRTMYLDADDVRNEDGSTYSSSNDFRVTKVGSFLRKTSLDELPQLINVLLGQMSIIGPRPTMTYPSLSSYSEKHKKRFYIKPGITGYSQAYFRNDVSQNDQFENDIMYYEKISFRLDLMIFFRTILMVLFRKKIYKREEKKS